MGMSVAARAQAAARMKKTAILTLAIVTDARRSRVTQSCLIQDEPGVGVRFSYKMSLEERSGMLGVDHQHASTREVEPGTDPGVFGREQ